MNLNEISKQLATELQSFVGRNTEIEKLGNTYLNPDRSVSKCVFITGPHQIGKTILCLQFASTQLQEHPNKLIYIDFQRSVLASKSSLLRLTSNELEIPKKDIVATNNLDIDMLLLEINQKIRNLPSDTIIVLDEIERFLEFSEPKDFIYLLRGVTHSYLWPHHDEMPLLLILTRRDWQNLEWQNVETSPVLQRLQKIPIGNLDGDSSAILLLKTLADLRLDQSIKLKWAEIVTFLSGGHPFIIIHAAHIIKDMKTPAELSFDPIAERLLNLCDAYMKSIWQDLSYHEKFLVASMVAGEVQKVRIKSREHRSVYVKLHGTDQLIRKGVISSSETLFSPLFTWWIASNAFEFLSEFKKEEKSKFDLDKIKAIFDTISAAITTFQSLPIFIQALISYVK